MKKISLIILVLIIALSYSCTKEEKKLPTSIYGILEVNGTNDAIKIAEGAKKPQVILYSSSAGAFMGGPTWSEVSRTTVDKNAKFSFKLDLSSYYDYYLVYTGCDPDLYYSSINYYNVTYFPVIPGQSNNVILYVLANSWVRPRFINTNPNPNNQDVFRYSYGIGPCEDDYIIDSAKVSDYYRLTGPCDTLAPWIHKTWSGTNKFGILPPSNNYQSHEVKCKITRNGVTRDTLIIFTVPPYDTSVVEIRY